MADRYDQKYNDDIVQEIIQAPAVGNVPNSQLDTYTSNYGGVVDSTIKEDTKLNDDIDLNFSGDILSDEYSFKNIFMPTLNNENSDINVESKDVAKDVAISMDIVDPNELIPTSANPDTNQVVKKSDYTKYYIAGGVALLAFIMFKM